MILSSCLPSAQTLFAPASQVFFTASQISAAYSVSVCENVSGEYSYRKLVPCYTSSASTICRDQCRLTETAYCSASSRTSFV